MATRLIKRVRKKAGQPPGTLAHFGPPRTHAVTVSVIRYADGKLDEHLNLPVDKALPLLERPGVTWVDVNGVHDVGVVQKLGAFYGLHPLVLEDILTIGQRPKLEDYGEYLFLTLKMLSLDRKQQAVQVEEMSLVLGASYLLSFQETEADSFTVVKERLRKGTDRFIKAGPDYLAYAIVDMTVDNYFTVLEELGDLFEELQNNVLANPTPQTLQIVYRLKTELLQLRKAIWPLRDAIAAMQRRETSLISAATEPYLRDVQDHTIQIIDTVETMRDMLSGTLDIYLSSVSNRLNAVMKKLTIVATIFIPLTFIVGLYGMNFQYMPELHWHYGYLFVWGVMVVVAAIMIWWFKREKF